VATRDPSVGNRRQSHASHVSDWAAQHRTFPPHSIGIEGPVRRGAGIKVGPTPHMSEALKAAEWLLRANGLSAASIDGTTIPFRDR
jgi:hypothetical protein